MYNRSYTKKTIQRRLMANKNVPGNVMLVNMTALSPSFLISYASFATRYENPPRAVITSVLKLVEFPFEINDSSLKNQNHIT